MAGLSRLSRQYAARLTTATPRLDVQRPEGTTCLVLEVSLFHRRSLHHAKEPDIVRQCTSEQMCDTRTLTLDLSTGDGKIKAN
jgi:hypothetical protein